MPFNEEFISEKKLRRKTIISFSVFIVMIAVAVIGWKWLNSQPADNGALKPLRKVLNNNEGVFSKFFSNNHLAKTFPISAAVHHVRVNGSDGMSKDFDAAAWKLKVARA